MSGSDFIEKFRRLVEDEHLLAAGEEVVVGVSGGVDSVALLQLLVEYGASCRVLHVNYGLRGEDSDRDAALVARLCEQLEVPHETSEPPAGWAEGSSGESIQHLAREYRYRVFEDWARAHDIRKVAVAHHLDDQVETLILRLVRGSGLRGLTGMRPRRPISEGSSVELIRPLLTVTRAEILGWVSEKGFVFRDDRSNVDPRFDRARVRTIVVPALLEAFGESALRNIARSADHARAAIDEAVTARLRDDLRSAAVEDLDRALRVEALLKLDAGWRALVLLEATRRWLPDAPRRASVADRLSELLTAQPGKKAVFGRSAVWRDRDAIVFVPESARSQEDRPVTPGEPVHLDTGTLLVERCKRGPSRYSSDPNVEIADANLLSSPLSVGPWRAGERFRPIGMANSKKISDFLTDERVASHRKSGVLVLRSGEDVVWVVGHRLAETFKVGPETTGVVKLSFEPADAGRAAPGFVV